MIKEKEISLNRTISSAGDVSFYRRNWGMLPWRVARLWMKYERSVLISEAIDNDRIYVVQHRGRSKHSSAIRRIELWYAVMGIGNCVKGFLKFVLFLTAPNVLWHRTSRNRIHMSTCSRPKKEYKNEQFNNKFPTSVSNVFEWFIIKWINFLRFLSPFRTS